MSSAVTRGLALAVIMISVFVIGIVVLIRLIPGPHKSSDYLIIGCLATLLCLFTLFLIFISTWAKGPNTFFKRRRK